VCFQHIGFTLSCGIGQSKASVSNYQSEAYVFSAFLGERRKK